MLKKVLMLAWALPLFTCLASTSMAEDKTVRCQRYADSAVAQQTANTSRNCGLTGPRWSADHAAHYNWCMAGQNSSLPKALRRRTRHRRLSVSTLGTRALTTSDLWPKQTADSNNTKESVIWTCFTNRLGYTPLGNRALAPQHILNGFDGTVKT